MRSVRFAALAVALVVLAAREARADGGYLGIYLTDENVATHGAYIEDVAPKSPAAEAGMKTGDLVTSVNGTKTPSSHELIAVLVAASPNDTLVVKLSRDGWEKELKVVLGSRGEPKKMAQPKTEAPADTGERGFLGCFLKANPEGPGAFIDQVVPDSPGAKAMLKKGDIVTGVNGKAVKDYTEFKDVLMASKPGDKLVLRVSRESWEREVTVVLGKKTAEKAAPPTAVKPAEPGPVKEAPKSKKPAFMGVSIVDQDGKGPLKVDDVQPNSPAEKAGLKPGDVILSVGQKKCANVKDFEDALRGHFAGDEVLVHLEREGWGRDVKVILGERSEKD